MNKFLENTKLKYSLISGEDPRVQEILSSQSLDVLKNFVGDLELLVVDEAQHIKNIGLNLKIVVDGVPSVRVIATGSSAFDLAKKVGEPLVGRKFTLKLYPLSEIELNPNTSKFEAERMLEQRLIYGSYPEVITRNDAAWARSYLKEIVSSYLYRDVAQLGEVQKPEVIIKLLQLLAFQIGSEVSLTELGTQLGLHKDTISRYLFFLQEAFVIHSLGGFSRNLRKEITKTMRFYFYDNGIRNALIDNFNPIALRNDIGMLWENYLVTERMKKREYIGPSAGSYFWRTWDKKEVDLVEMREGKLLGYEFKWSKTKIPKAPRIWLETYPNEATYEVINPSNYLDFIT